MKQLCNTILVLFTSISSLHGQTVKELIEKGNNFYSSQAYDKAQSIYEEAIRKDQVHQWPQAIFNLGNSLFLQKKYDEAAQQFRSLSKSNSFPELKAPATYNLGNCFLEQKNYEAAIAAYKETLKLNPKDEDARYNLWYANALLTRDRNQSTQQKTVNEKEQTAPPPTTNLTPEDLQRMLQELDTAENQTLQNRKKQPQRRKKELNDW